MYILFIAHSNKFKGGANRSLFSVVSGLNKRDDIDITVLLPKKEGEMNKALNKEGIRHLSYRYHTIITKRPNGISGILRRVKLFLKFILDMILSARIAWKLRNSKFDIVYTNTRVVVVGAFIARILKLPHIWHVRDFIE